jgi:glycine/sarcosine N-methyltransferase
MANVELYDDTADIYDIFELNGTGDTPITNDLLMKCFRKHDVRSVLDMTCGTGAQTIGLCRAGFAVTGSDLSKGMIEVAIRKSAGLPIPYHQADMRTVSLGQFDAIISMFNAVGHLSTADFGRAIRNAAQNLRSGGVYVFDIFNRDMMGLSPKYEIIDAVKEVAETKYVRFTRSAYEHHSGRLSLSQKTYVQRGREEPRIIPDEYTLQTYRAGELRELLLANGFAQAEITGDGMLDVFGIKGLCHLAIGVKA